MKKIAMTICGIAFISGMALAQGVDSTKNQNGSTGINDNSRQDSAFNQSANPQSIEGTPRTQDPTNSPTTQPLPQQQSQPQLQSEPPVQSQPELQPEPLQTQPQVPTQSQPTLNPNNPAQQNRVNEPIQPNQPTQPVQRVGSPTTDPAGSGTKPPK
jgi:hypothetical protein